MIWAMAYRKILPSVHALNSMVLDVAIVTAYYYSIVFLYPSNNIATSALEGSSDRNKQ